MSPKPPLEGRKIAVLVESQYITAEIALYVQRFTEYGATVHLMANLYGNSSLTFVSEVENPEHMPETLKVNIDHKDVKLDEYAAVIQSANYTSVRLRHFPAPKGADGQDGPITADLVRSSPTVKFFGRAMRNPEIVKGVLCHGLWILTPTPELLAGRRVICHQVVLADVINAGGLFVDDPSGVVVDRDLVTGRTANDAAGFVDAIRDVILAREDARLSRGGAASSSGAAQPATSAVSSSESAGGARTKRKILVVLSNFGYWGEELVGPLDAFDRVGYLAEFATPTGRRPVALTPSMDENYVDPPLGRPVTTLEMAAKVREIDDTGPNRSPRARRLDNPLNLSALLPERPYFSQPVLVRALEAYYAERDRALRAFGRFDALLIVGGSGPIVDLANNQRVHDLILGFVGTGRPVAAECYGVACLAFARDMEDRRSLIRNKHVTGHCIEYDYKDGTGFMGVDFNMGPPPYPLEYILRDATAPDGAYHGNFGKETSVIVDYPFITGRSTPDSTLTGEKLVEVLDQGLRRWGW
jgi:putative intracellular protease/amidase